MATAEKPRPFSPDTHRTKGWLTREALRQGYRDKRAGRHDGVLHEVILQWDETTQRYCVTHRTVPSLGSPEERTWQTSYHPLLADARKAFRAVTW